MSKVVAEALYMAAEVLSEKGWTQGKLRDSVTGQMCAMGAIDAVLYEMYPFNVTDSKLTALHHQCALESQMVKALVSAVGITTPGGMEPGNNIPDWNDAPERTAEDVILGFKRAAEYVEAQQQ